jgi:hypothetical protein
MTTMPNRRMTLIVTREPKRSWKQTNVLFVDSIPRLHGAVATHDVERIILDRCATADEYLDLLASLPDQVAGDVMNVRQDGGAFLSSIGRGGDRVLYALAPHDVGFYLETHGLTANRGQLALIA